MNNALLLAALAAQTQPGAEIDAQIAALQAEVAALTSSVAELQATPPNTIPGVYVATDWIPDGGDLSDAIDAIQRDPGCGPFDGSGNHRTGCKILIPRGVYDTKTIHVCRSLILEGTGGYGSGPNTLIRTNGETGIHVHVDGYCEGVLGFGPGNVGTEARGGFTVIRDLALRDMATTSTSSLIWSAGIHLEERAHVEQVSVARFTQGIRIVASFMAQTVNYDPANGWFLDEDSNANVFGLRDVFVTGSRHHGIFINGSDANAGYAIGADVVGSCAAAELYEPVDGFDCANIYDSSFLGNTWIASHSALTTDGLGQTNNQFRSDSANAANVWVGTYSEEGNGPSMFSARDLVLGGTVITQPSGAMELGDGQINGFCSNTGAATLGSQVCLGSRAQGGLISLTATAAPFSGLGVLSWRPEDFGGVPVWSQYLDSIGSGIGRTVARTQDGYTQGERIERRLGTLPTCPAGTTEENRLWDNVAQVSTPAGWALCEVP